MSCMRRAALVLALLWVSFLCALAYVSLVMMDIPRFER